MDRRLDRAAIAAEAQMRRGAPGGDRRWTARWTGQSRAAGHCCAATSANDAHFVAAIATERSAIIGGPSEAVSGRCVARAELIDVDGEVGVRLSDRRGNSVQPGQLVRVSRPVRTGTPQHGDQSAAKGSVMDNPTRHGQRATQRCPSARPDASHGRSSPTAVPPAHSSPIPPMTSFAFGKRSPAPNLRPPVRDLCTPVSIASIKKRPISRAQHLRGVEVLIACGRSLALRFANGDSARACSGRPPLASGSVLSGQGGLIIQHPRNPFKRHKLNAETVREWEELSTREGVAGVMGQAAAKAALPGMIGKAVGAGLGAAMKSGHAVRVNWADGNQSIIELPEKLFMIFSVLLAGQQVVTDASAQAESSEPLQAGWRPRGSWTSLLR